MKNITLNPAEWLFFLLIIMALLSGCERCRIGENSVIKTKWIGEDGNCSYFYSCGEYTSQEFQDACDKYSVGDTLKGTAK